MELFPPVPLESWRETKETLHRFEQVVGKVRLAAAVHRNHWWQVPFHLTTRGITTRPTGTDPTFSIDFDFLDHHLRMATVEGRQVVFPLTGLSVAGFHRRVTEGLEQLGVSAPIRAVPFDLDDATPFAEDDRHATYVPEHAHRYWVVLGQVAQVLEEFAGRSYAKTSPVHHFWHTFDLAVTRVSDRRVPQPAGVDRVTAEAYSHEVISCGFWFGDAQVPEPAFYAYTAPEPDGLVEEPLRPEAARWVPSRGAHLALLRYADARVAPDPRAVVLDFYESAYAAGARRAGWDVEALHPPGTAAAVARAGPRR